MNYKYPKNKYSNKSCKCKTGHVHDSRGEASYCDELRLEKKAGLIKDYQSQKTFRFYVNEQLITSHRVDFLIELPDGKSQVREYKGLPTDAWRIKHKLFEALYPEIEYIVIWHNKKKNKK